MTRTRFDSLPAAAALVAGLGASAQANVKVFTDEHVDLVSPNFAAANEWAEDQPGLVLSSRDASTATAYGGGETLSFLPEDADIDAPGTVTALRFR